MSCSLNSRIARRRLCIALAAPPLAGLRLARAQATPDAPALAPALAGLRRWGSGEFRRFGFLVYEATLWAAQTGPLQPPLALALTYRRQIAGRDIAQASVEQMRRFSTDEPQLARWGEQMARLFPDVAPGDRIVGLQGPERVRFFHNDRALGAVEGAAFATTFFAIWLDERTSAPALRAALLRPPGG